MDHDHDDAETELRIDALGRRAGGELRHAAPEDGVASVARRMAVRRRNRTAGGGVAVALAIAGGAVYLGGRSDSAAPVSTLPPSPGATWLREYVGGTTSVPSGQPVKIAVAEPEDRQTGAARAAVELLNEQLGGIDGHPVELVTCLWKDSSTRSGCSTQLAGDPSIIAIVHEYLSSAEFATAPDSPPRLGGLIQAGAIRTSYAPSVIQNWHASARVSASLLPGGRGKVVVLGPGISAQYFDDAAPGVEFVDAATPPGRANVGDALRATDADAPDVVIAWGLDCGDLEGALEDVGIADVPVVTDTCDARHEGWYYVDVPFNPDHPEANDGAAAALDELDARGYHPIADDSFDVQWRYSAEQFADVLTVAKIANSIGLDAALDHEHMHQAFRDFTGPTIFSGAQDCTPEDPLVEDGACATTAVVLQMRNGKFVTLDPVSTS